MFFKRLIKNDPQTDADLLRAYARTGKLSYLGVLYDRYMHLVYGVCLKYLQEKEASKDAVMQIFEKLIESLKVEKVNNFKSWLYVVAKNHCLMELRAKKRANGHEDIHLLPDLAAPDTGTAQEERWQLLEHGLQSLPLEQQRCIQLFYLEQKTYQDIADLTGFELKKVKSYIQNGKRNLKIFINKREE